MTAYSNTSFKLLCKHIYTYICTHVYKYPCIASTFILRREKENTPLMKGNKDEKHSYIDN